MNDWAFCDGRGGLEASPARRAVLGAGLGAALWWAGAKTAWAQAAVRPGRADGPVLVVVFLRGAADGLNIVAPYQEDAYYRLRPTLGIAQPGDKRRSRSERLIELDGFFGLNPALGMLVPHFREGRLGFVHACGSGDTTRSHFEAMSTMERGAESRPGELMDGWLARHLGTTSERRDPMRAVALSGTSPDSLLGATSALSLSNLEQFRLGLPAGPPAQALEALYADGGDLVSQAGRDSLEILRELNQLDPRAYRPAPGVTYPETDFGRSMRQVAFLVKNGFGLEVAALDLGGWDTHIAQGTTSGWLTNLLTELGGGLDALLRDLGVEAGRVTVVVQTEFGRRIEENSGFGTDHGRGGVMFVAGAGVVGGRVHGDWPTLAPDKQVGPGDLAVTTDYRDVLAEILKNRLANPRAAEVFPGASGRPLGIVG